METIVRKVYPGHFSLEFNTWNIDGMAGRENHKGRTNSPLFRQWVFQSREYGGLQ